MTEFSSSSSKESGNICDEELLDDRKSHFEMAFITLANDHNLTEIAPDKPLSQGKSDGSKSLKRVMEQCSQS